MSQEFLCGEYGKADTKIIFQVCSMPPNTNVIRAQIILLANMKHVSYEG